MKLLRYGPPGQEKPGLLDAAGNLISYDGVIKDITDAKAAQEQLKDREIRFFELFNTIRSSVAVYKAIDNGTDFVFVDFNKAAEKTENIPKNEVIGRRVSEVFPGVREFGLLDVIPCLADRNHRKISERSLCR